MAYRTPELIRVLEGSRRTLKEERIWPTVYETDAQAERTLHGHVAFYGQPSRVSPEARAGHVATASALGMPTRHGHLAVRIDRCRRSLARLREGLRCVSGGRFFIGEVPPSRGIQSPHYPR